MRYYVLDFDSNKVLFMTEYISEICDWVYKNQELIINKNISVVNSNLELVDIW